MTDRQKSKPAKSAAPPMPSWYARWRSNRPYSRRVRAWRTDAWRELARRESRRTEHEPIFSDRRFFGDAEAEFWPLVKENAAGLSAADADLNQADTRTKVAEGRQTEASETVRRRRQDVRYHRHRCGLPADAPGFPDQEPPLTAHPDPPERTTPENLHPDQHIDVDALQTRAKRRYRRLIARTADGVIVLFDELFFFQVYLTITGLDLTRSRIAQLAVGVPGGLFLGLLSPIVVIVAAHVLAEHVARVRAGMVSSPPGNPTTTWQVVTQWLKRHGVATLAGLILLMASFAFARAAAARLSTAPASDDALRSAMSLVLMLLFFALPWVVFLAHLYAENPKADRLAALREEHEARPLTDLRLAEQALADALVEETSAKNETVAAKADREAAWDRLYVVVHDVASEVDHLMVKARNLAIGVRPLMAWPDSPEGTASYTKDLVESLEKIAVDWSPLEPHLHLLERIAPDDKRRQQVHALRTDTARMRAVPQREESSGKGTVPVNSSHPEAVTAPLPMHPLAGGKDQ
ncbi:hypothetical protein [Amycolatopsis minnesotensis]